MGHTHNFLLHILFFSLLFHVIKDDGQIENDVFVRLDMETLNIVASALLKIAESRLYEFPIRDITNMDCWLATIPAPALDSSGVRLQNQEVFAALEAFSGSLFNANLNMTCIDCSSPGMLEMSDLLLKEEAQNSFLDTMNSMMQGFIAPLVTGELVQFQIDQMLTEASRKCPHRPDYSAAEDSIEYDPLPTPQTDYDATYLMIWGIVVLALIAATIVVMAMIRCTVHRRHRRWLSSIPTDQKDRLKMEQHREDIMEKELNETTKSMFQSPEVPFLLRWSMPLIILGNIALFLSGHLSLGATVNIIAQVGGESIEVDQFYEFSIARSTIDIWNAGGKALAVLILIFSGIWPYTKQLITLIVWFLPTSLLSVSKRGSILLWLDWLAKWSMVDIFVLVISIAAFRFSIQSPDVAFLPEDFYSIDLLVVPMWGLYANMTAQLVSQVSSHFIIHYHRSIVNKGTESFKNRHQLASSPGLHGMLASRKNPGESASSEPYAKTVLKNHQFGRPHRGQEEKLVIKNWVNFLFVFLVSSLVVLVIVGSILPSLSTEILGVIGIAVESGQKFQPATTDHSIFTLVALLIEEAKFLGNAGSYIGLGVLSFLFLFTVMIVPMLQSISLMFQWFYPMTMIQRTRMSITNEILQAWQYIEVYLIALFVACWQLGPVSQWMFGTYCEGFNGFFAQMVQYGLIDKEDAQCFSVQGYIEPGSIILAAGAIILIFVNTLVNKAVMQYFFDKKVELEKELLPEVTADEESNEKQLYKNSSSSPSTTTIRPVPVMFTDTFRWFLHRGGTSSDNVVEAIGSDGGEGTADGQDISVESGANATDEKVNNETRESTTAKTETEGHGDTNVVENEKSETAVMNNDTEKKKKKSKGKKSKSNGKKRTTESNVTIVENNV